jgi:hypothetical protein
MTFREPKIHAMGFSDDVVVDSLEKSHSIRARIGCRVLAKRISKYTGNVRPC